jgi:hypothetical protein
MLTYQFPKDRPITQEDVADFEKHQKMAFVAARGFNVAYELIGNLRKADWYNQVSNTCLTVCSSKIEPLLKNMHLFFSSTSECPSSISS